MIDEETKQYVRRIAEALEQIGECLLSERGIYIRSSSDAKSKAGKARASQTKRGPDGAFSSSNEQPPPSIQSQSAIGSVQNNILIATYIEAWQERYKTKNRPDISKAAQIFKRLSVGGYSQEKIQEDLKVYCKMTDDWFVRKCHDIVTFGENIGKIELERDRQAKLTQTKAQPERIDFEAAQAIQTCDKCSNTGYASWEDEEGRRFLARCDCALGQMRDSEGAVKNRKGEIETVEIPTRPPHHVRAMDSKYN